MYVVFHSNFAAYIVYRRYKPCEFLEFVWTDCWGNKSNYVITSPANRDLFIIDTFDRDYKCVIYLGTVIRNRRGKESLAISKKMAQNAL